MSRRPTSSLQLRFRERLTSSVGRVALSVVFAMQPVGLGAQDVSLELTSVLRGPEGVGFSEPGYLLATTRLGDRWVVNSRDAIYAFGTDGSFHRQVGRPGNGPGEWSAIVWVAARGDSAAVFDIGNARVSILDNDLRVARSFRFGVLGFDRALWLPDGRFVVAAGFQEDPDRLGYALAFLAPDGTLSEAFDEYEMLPGVHSAARKRHLQLVGDTIVALSLNDGTVRYWSLSGEQLAEYPPVGRPRGWTKAYTETRGPPMAPGQIPPSTYLSALDTDRWRLLGAMTPAEDWESGFTAESIDFERVFRGSLQVVSKDHATVAQERFLSFLPVVFADGYVVSPRADDLGFTFLEIRRVSQTRD